METNRLVADATVNLSQILALVGMIQRDYYTIWQRSANIIEEMEKGRNTESSCVSALNFNF